MSEHGVENDAASTSIQHRCVRMREHHRGGCACHPRLPIPCPDCYSLRVTTERLPYQESTPWTRDIPPVVGDAS